MKKITFILLVTIAFSLNAQTIDYNTDDGLIAKGYDVVAYFDNTAKKGSSRFISTYDSVKYKFYSQKNMCHNLAVGVPMLLQQKEQKSL